VHSHQRTPSRTRKSRKKGVAKGPALPTAYGSYRKGGTAQGYVMDSCTDGLPPELTTTTATGTALNVGPNSNSKTAHANALKDCHGKHISGLSTLKAVNGGTWYAADIRREGQRADGLLIRIATIGGIMEVLCFPASAGLMHTALQSLFTAGSEIQRRAKQLREQAAPAPKPDAPTKRPPLPTLFDCSA